MSIANALGVRTGAQASIYGANQTNMATIPPDLNSISNNSTLNVSANTGPMNLWQLTTLDGTFEESRNVEVFQNQNANGQIVIQGNFQYWTPMKNIVLNMPIGLLFADSNYNTANPPVITYSKCAHSGVDPLSQWVQPEFCFLSPLTRCEVALGENVVVMQKTPMNAANFGIYPIPLDIKSEPQSLIKLSHLGMPYTLGDNLVYSGGTWTMLRSEWRPVVRPPLPYGYADYYDQWKDLYFNEQFKGQTGLPSTALPSITYQTQLAIPLYMLNSFFNQDAMLPPNLKFKITIECILTPVLAAFNNNSGTTPDANGLNMYVTWNSGTGGGISIKYRSYQMNRDLQKSLNLEWAAKNILYNFKTYDYIQFPGNGATQYIEGNITLSQQRPEQIVFRIMNVTNAAVKVATAAANYPCFDNAIDFPFSTSCAFSIIELELYFSGRDNYRFRMNDAGIGNYDAPALGAVAFYTNELNQKTYARNGCQPFRMDGPFNKRYGKEFVVSTNPGDIQQMNLTALDNGAVVCRFRANIVTTAGVNANNRAGFLPATHALVSYKYYRMQALVDSGGQITTVEWPAIMGGNTGKESDFIIGSTSVMN